MNSKKIIIPISILIVASYIVNFIPSIKYPDSSIHAHHLILSAACILSFLIFSLISKRSIFKFFLVTGMLSGLLIFTLIYLESYFLGNLFFDMLSSIYYVLYIVFVTPLFGINQVLNAEVAYLSLFTSSIYLVLYLVQIKNRLIKKVRMQSWRGRVNWHS